MTTLVVAVFLILFALRTAVEAVLSVLNLRHAAASGATVPEPLAGRIPAETAARSLDYTLARGRLGLAHGAFGAGLTLAVLFSGLLPWLDGALRSARIGGAPLAGAHGFVAFLVALSVGLGAAHLPFRLYAVFGIETRFGFNRMGWRLWLADRAKSLALSAALGVPFLYGVYGFMAYAGEWWWLWLFCFVTVFQLAMVWLYPVAIAPLFNRFTPLPEGELRSAVEALAHKAGFRTRGLYQMDASRRSGHSNAYFTGFFRPRIVLFDTLLERLGLDEALSVLAHEMGHYRALHVHKSLAIHLVLTLAVLWVLGRLVDWPPLYAAFGFEGPSPQAALALLMLCGGAFVFWLGPLAAWWSRRNEFQADAFAVRLSESPAALTSALIRLNGDNLSNLHPHPWFSRYHYSHPTLLERIEAVERLAGGASGCGGGTGAAAATGEGR